MYCCQILYVIHKTLLESQTRKLIFNNNRKKRSAKTKTGRAHVVLHIDRRPRTLTTRARLIYQYISDLTYGQAKRMQIPSEAYDQREQSMFNIF